MSIATFDHDELRDTLASIQDDINSEFSEELGFMEGTTGRWPADRIIRTGSLALDMATGIGGWPRGRIIEMFGQESSGKTSTALHAVRSAQRQGLAVAYIDAESALDPNYMRKLGIDLSLLLISQPRSLEVAINVINRLMETRKVALIVLDSVAAMKAQVVIDGDAETETRAAEARRWAAQLPKIANNAAETQTTLMLLNQMREGQDIYTPFTTPGGTAIKFNASIRCMLKRRVEGKKGDGIDYQTVNADLIKNKVGSPFRKASYTLRPPKPIDWCEDVVTEASAYGIINEDGKYDEDGQPFSKNGWYSYKFSPGELELIVQDDPEVSVDSDGDINESGFYHGDGFTTFEAYRFGKFLEFMRRWPSLVHSIEEQVLDTLNDDEITDDPHAGISADGSAALINNVDEG